MTRAPSPAARTAALESLLVARGILTRAEIDATEAAVRAPNPLWGAHIVAHAWADPAFRAALLADGMEGPRWLGVPFRDGRLHVVANAPGEHNLVVCTLCSCWPRNLLGQPPLWYVSRAYRARAVREPRAVLAELGVSLPEGTRIRVHDSTAELRYMVLPERPAGTEGWDEPALAALVTRDSMVGADLPRAPA